MFLSRGRAMKLFRKYSSKLLYVYSKRLGCTVGIAIFSSYAISIMLWLLVANKEAKTSGGDAEYKGVFLTVAVLLVSLFIAPLFLRRKKW